MPARSSSKSAPSALGLLAVGAVFAWAACAQARTFANSYISFDLPNDWDCKMEGTEWVCEEEDSERHIAIIIMTAKEAGPGDTLDEYYDHLAQTKTLTDGDRPLRRSRIRSLQRNRIDGQEWIDCEQFESELPNYVTRYLATVKGDVAVLITLSAHRTTYSSMGSTFDAVIGSLQVNMPRAR